MLTSVLYAVVYIIGLPYRLIWFLLGWHVEGELPKLDKIVMIAAPHTSNWDYATMLPAALKFGRRPLTTTKHTLFKPPFGWLLRLSGAFPVDRSHAMGVVDQLVEKINNTDRILLMFTPEGTRSKSSYWKIGFYQAALKAEIPIVCGCINYQRKVISVSDPIYPTGDLEADFEKIKAYYEANGYPRYPEKLSDMVLRERDIRRVKEQLELAEQV